MDKNEKLLKSIDNTLSEILKELKRQGRREVSTTHVTIDANDVKDMDKVIKQFKGLNTSGCL